MATRRNKAEPISHRGGECQRNLVFSGTVDCAHRARILAGAGGGATVRPRHLRAYPPVPAPLFRRGSKSGSSAASLWKLLSIWIARCTRLFASARSPSWQA